MEENIKNMVNGYSAVPEQALSVQYRRTEAAPIDESSFFVSYADALEYAKGLYRDYDEQRPRPHDSRGLAGSAYIGQVISVREGDTVTIYKIVKNPDSKYLGMLEEIGSGTTYEAGDGIKIEGNTISVVEPLDCGTF